MENKPDNNIKPKEGTILKAIFRTLPVLGALLILFSVWRILSQGRLNILVEGAYMGAGMLLYLTLFVKAEVANLKYYLHVLIYSVFVLAICVVAYLFVKQYSPTYDLTKNRLFSLNDQSVKVIKNLKDPVDIVVFTAVRAPFQGLQDLYAMAGNKIRWTFINAREDIINTNKYGNNIKNDTIMVIGPKKKDAAADQPDPLAGRRKKDLNVSELFEPQSRAMRADVENTLTNALIEVSRDKEVKVYFTKGHGELAFEGSPSTTMMRRQPNEQSGPSVAVFRKYLGDKAMQTAELNLIDGVPADAALVVVAGPQIDLNESEAKALEAYLGRDGKLLVMLDVPTNTQVAAQPLTNIKKFLAKYGVDAPEKIVLDIYGKKFAGSLAKPALAWISPDHPITSDYAGRIPLSFLDSTRPIVPGENSGGYKVTELMKSSPQSWSEDLSVLTSGHTAPPAERSAQSLAVAVSQAPPPSRPGMPAPEVKGGMRMVVTGCSELIDDSLQTKNQLAVGLMLNTANWLTQQEDLIAIEPRQVPGTPLILDDGQMKMVFLLSVLVIPAVMFFGGLTYSLLRRAR